MRPDPFVIQRATPEDADSLLPLIEAYWVFEGIPDFDPDVVRRPLAQILSSSDLGVAWLARDSGRSVGYLILVYVFSLEHRGLTAEIDEFFIVQEHRDAGLGSALLAEAEAEATRRGCTNLSFQIASVNQPAYEFYGRRGYTARSSFRLLEKSIGAG